MLEKLIPPPKKYSSCVAGPVAIAGTPGYEGIKVLPEGTFGVGAQGFAGVLQIAPKGCLQRPGGISTRNQVLLGAYRSFLQIGLLMCAARLGGLLPTTIVITSKSRIYSKFRLTVPDRKKDLATSCPDQSGGK